MCFNFINIQSGLSEVNIHSTTMNYILQIQYFIDRTGVAGQQSLQTLTNIVTTFIQLCFNDV